eukprot:gene16389-biopygen305
MCSPAPYISPCYPSSMHVHCAAVCSHASMCTNACSLLGQAPRPMDGQAMEGQATKCQAIEGQAMEGQAMEGQAMECQAMEGRAMEGQAKHALVNLLDPTNTARISPFPTNHPNSSHAYSWDTGPCPLPVQLALPAMV